MRLPAFSSSFSSRILALSLTTCLATAPFAQAEVITTTPPPAATTGASTLSDTQSHPASFANLAEKLLPAVVNISTVQVVDINKPDFEFPMGEGSPFEQFRDFFENQTPNSHKRSLPRTQHATSLGSGFIIDADKGYIVTNQHVIKDAEAITVILQDDTRIEAKLVGSDDKTDLALLKINPKGHKLTAVNWGNSDAMRVGDWVLAIGNPYGLGGTVTQGIISARARDIHSGPYDDFLQTDAAINRGNSGGPMFNLKGEVIGINTAIFSTTGGSIGIGFAVPSAIAKNVTDQILEYGRTKRGWLGVRIQEVTDGIAESIKGFGKARGALVAGVSDDSPATKAGIKTGDIILSFDGTNIDEMRMLPRLVAETKIDRTVKITLWRDGETKDVDLKVGELEVAEEQGLVENGTQNEDSDSKPAGTESYGLTLSEITGAVRKDFDLSADTKGVIITDINPDTPAIDQNLQIGDVIVQADQKEVKSPEEFKKIADDVMNSGRKSLFLLVDHEGDMIFVALPLEKSTEKDKNKDKEPKPEAETQGTEEE